jgi:hypothetical protein
MSVAANCPECCACPEPTTEWDSVSASKTKLGFGEFTDVSSPPKIYRTATLANLRLFDSITGGGGFNRALINDAFTVGYEGPVGQCDIGFVGDIYEPTAGGTVWYFAYFMQPTYSGQAPDLAVTVSSDTDPTYACGETVGVVVYVNSISPHTSTATVGTYDNLSGGDEATLTISDEYTTAQLKTNTVSALPAFDGDWNDTAGSFANLSTDELSYAARASRYRHRFPIPKVGPGACYRLEWVERFIAEAGVALDSAEIVTRGVYRPTVSSSGGGGTGLLLVAVMSSTGTVSAIRILNPGSGYTSAPTITVQSATGGGTTSTGWTATVAGGQVTTITGGSAGNYLPTGAFSGGGGTGATITFTMDETGGLATATLGSGGSGYTSAPTLTITSKVGTLTGARIPVVHLHLGTETDRCAVWDGDIPEDYDPEDEATWPILGDGTDPYFSLAVPATDGTTLVANVRAFCDCAECP